MSRHKILIADDEEGIRESLSLILGDQYQLEFAEDGQAAFSKLANGKYDLVFLDIKMPKLDGLQLLRRLKSLGLTLPPILMLTAYQSVELAREAIRLGAADYLPKPFERDQILTAVRDTLKGHGASVTS